MKEHKPIYEEIYNFKNLIYAYEKAKKCKSKKPDVIKFKQDLWANIYHLSKELKETAYSPKLLKTFILRDPKTRKISKSDFRDRVVHHAIVRIIGHVFERIFIYDSCANRIGKGNLFAIKRFEKFKRKVTKNFSRNAFCLKADIKHYFDEVDQEILINIIKKKIFDDKIIWLIREIINNFNSKIKRKGMPLSNLTSQFFANVYLHELDFFVKHTLRAKYYIRYVDDFIILHESKEQLETWKNRINEFLKEKLSLKLHAQKSKIIPLSRGVDFVGFRIFLNYRLLRKRNIKNMKRKIELFKEGLLDKEKLEEIFQGWNAYAKWANSYNLRRKLRI
jgi:hypothetical protein